MKVCNEIVMALDSGFSTVLLLLDFSAVFDCVDHSILLKVLQLQFGIAASALLWISSSLAVRSHSVKLSGFHLKSLLFFYCPSRFNSWSPPLYSVHLEHCKHCFSTWPHDPRIC